MPHTSGPWAADQSGLVTAGKNRLHIAQVATTGMGHAADANARLIATAPELLECLLDVLDSDGDLYAMDFDRYRAAITRAIGE